jgi:hypothetical protein
MRRHDWCSYVTISPATGGVADHRDLALETEDIVWRQILRSGTSENIPPEYVSSGLSVDAGDEAEAAVRAPH